MKVVIINGGPRKGWNTDMLLQKAAEGAKSMGAEVETINLYDIDFKGCRSCFACKTDGPSLGRCTINDGLKEVLEQVDKCDGLILGSPVYWGDVTAELRAFWERFLYQYANFDDYAKHFYKGHMKVGCVYTMNADEQYNIPLYEKYERFVQMYTTYAGTVASAETLQVADYSKVHFGCFDEAQRRERRETVFPQDCEKAFALGKAVATL